jgi:glycosyltransferase involved in cell wall biosynthesis
MPEVAGDAALLVDPFSPESIASAMETIYEDEPLRNNLIRNGKLRQNEFTWEKTAELFWASIEKAISTN